MSDLDGNDDQAGAENLDAEKIGDVGSDEPTNYPLDRPVAVEDHGTTADEEETGESVRRRARREVPEVDQADVIDRPDIGAGLTSADDDPRDGELLGELDDDPGFATAEEDAMHIVDEP